MTPSVTVRPGFGKLPDIPKTLSAKSASGGKNVTATQSNLKSAATQTISTSTLSNEWRAQLNNNSSNFVPGQKPIEFRRDRTVTVPHGAFADAGGKHQLESDMGMTKRSTERLLKQQAELQKQQQMAMLNQLNLQYGNGIQQPKMSLGQFISDISTLFTGAFSIGKNVSSSVATAKTISNNETVAMLQKATTASDLQKAMDSASDKLKNLETESKQQDTQIMQMQGDLSGLKSKATSAEKAVSDNKTAISQKNSEVSNNIQRESASQMAMNAAQSQVDMLKSQLATASPLTKAGIEASLAQAEQQLELKTKQYEEAVKLREQSQSELKNLQDATPGLEESLNVAKANVKEKESSIQQLQSAQVKVQTEMNDILAGLSDAQSRLAELQKQEGNDKKA